MHEPAKLCFVATDAVSFNVLYRGQLEFLAASGFRLTLICGGNVHEMKKLRARNVGKVIDFSLVRDPNIWIDLVSLFKIFWHFLWNRYETVVCTTPKALLLGSIAAFCTLQKRRIAFFQGRVYENYWGIRRRFYVFLDRIAIAGSHEVLFVSNSLMHEFQKDIPVVKRKGSVVGAGSANGVDVESFSYDAFAPEDLLELRLELGLEASDFVIVIAGRINADKGIKEIADVIEKMRAHRSSVRFLFVGRFESADAERHIGKFLTSGSVVHVGFTSDIARYMALADLHLFLSHREGFGNVAIEAAACGIPTIAFDVVGIRDSVSEGVSGWRVPFGDADAVVLKLIKLSTSPNRPLIQGARTWAVEHFAQEKVWYAYASHLGLNHTNLR